MFSDEHFCRSEFTGKISQNQNANEFILYAYIYLTEVGHTAANAVIDYSPGISKGSGSRQKRPQPLCEAGLLIKNLEQPWPTPKVIKMFRKLNLLSYLAPWLWP